MVSNDDQLNSVRLKRMATGWSQQELADRTGLSRAGISAIESGRLAPSVHAALALAHALHSTVEELFGVTPKSTESVEWGIAPNTPRPRYWYANIGSETLSYPIAEDSTQLDWHDAVYNPVQVESPDPELADRTLVVAGCDPSAHLLAAEYHRQFQFRMIVLRRNSRESLQLLTAGKVHVAGMHFGRSEEKSANRKAARESLGKKCSLIRVAKWEEGVAVSPALESSSISSLLRRRARWIGREEGSGARQLQEEVLGSRPAPRRMALDHRMMAACIKAGWGDAGACVRLCSEEAGLHFISLHAKHYDFCFRDDMSADPRVSALLATLRSRRFRSKLAELPGYHTEQTGELI